MNDIFWIGEVNGGQELPLAIVLRPRGDDWLEDETVRIKHSGVEVLVSMLEVKEAEYLGLGDESKAADQAGLKFVSYPIPDRETPRNISTFRSFVAELADSLQQGTRIGVHCRGSIGRATIAAAGALIHLGWEPHEALAAIEAARGCQVPDTEEQRDWILGYQVQP